MARARAVAGPGRVRGGRGARHLRAVHDRPARDPQCVPPDARAASRCERRGDVRAERIAGWFDACDRGDASASSPALPCARRCRGPRRASGVLARAAAQPCVSAADPSRGAATRIVAAATLDRGGTRRGRIAASVHLASVWQRHAQADVAGLACSECERGDGRHLGGASGLRSRRIRRAHQPFGAAQRLHCRHVPASRAPSVSGRTDAASAHAGTALRRRTARSDPHRRGVRTGSTLRRRR